MKHLFAKLALLVVATSLVTTLAESQQQILNWYLGNWQSETILNSSLWVPKRKQLVETHKVQWILDGHILQEITSHDDKEITLTLKRYNQKRTEFEMWSFQSSGDSSYWTGNWKKNSKTITWEYVDFGIGAVGNIVDHFTAQKEWVSSLVMKDKKGNLLLDVETKHNKQQPK